MSLKLIIKKLIPSSVLVGVRAFLESADLFLIRFFSINGFLSSVYFCFFSWKFHREQRAVLLGRLQYKRSLKEDGFNRALLRRNVHRIEKGLIMRPRREVFGEDYVLSTVECYIHFVNGLCEVSGDCKWAHDVLVEYFSAVKTTEKIKLAREMFFAVKLCPENDTKYIPYPRSASMQHSISFDQLMALFLRRRAVRWYLDAEVDNSLIKKAIQGASLAPSACNRQPYEFCVINKGSDASRIANCAMGTAGFSHNIPCLIAVIGNLSAYPAERDRHVIYIDGALAAMQLMLALEVLGLSSCPINWPDIEGRERRLARELGLEYHQRVVMLLSVGYADPTGGIPYSQKKSSEELMYAL